jgi:hypothetical protein
MRLLLTKYVDTTQTIIIVPLTLSPLCLVLLVRLVVYIVNLYSFYFYRLIGKLTFFLQLQVFSLYNSHLKSKVDNILTKTTELHITLNIEDSHIVSKSHTHPSHSTTSRLLTSSLSLGVPVPHVTQCM